MELPNIEAFSTFKKKLALDKLITDKMQNIIYKIADHFQNVGKVKNGKKSLLDEGN